MMISVERNFIFIHVAKTGGKTMKAALGPYTLRKATGQWRRLMSHLPVPEGPDAQFGPHASARWAKLKLPRAFFEGAFKFALVRNPYDLAVSRYAYVRGDARHHQHASAQGQSFADFLRAEKRRTIWRHRDQTAMLADFGGRMLVDKVYRFEAIEDAYRDVVERLNLPNAKPIQHRNESRRDSYRSYYGDAERRLVEHIWARDIANFDYKF